MMVGLDVGRCVRVNGWSIALLRAIKDVVKDGGVSYMQDIT